MGAVGQQVKLNAAANHVQHNPFDFVYSFWAVSVVKCHQILHGLKISHAAYLCAVQLMYQHSEKGGKLLIDGHNAFRQYHLGPCSDFTSVLFGGLSPLLTGRPLKVRGLKSLCVELY